MSITSLTIFLAQTAVVQSLLGLDPSLPEHLVLAIKQRIVIPTAQLNFTPSTGCSSLDGPYGLRRASTPVSGFTGGNFFGPSPSAYFEAIGRLVADADDLKQLARPEKSADRKLLTLPARGYTQHRFPGVVGGISGRAEFSGILQGLRDSEHVWWCWCDRKKGEISDVCAIETSVLTVDEVRVFATSEGRVEINYEREEYLLHQVLVSKDLPAQYRALSSSAAVTTLAEATAKNLKYKTTALIAMPDFRMYDFLARLHDASVQRVVETKVWEHLTSRRSLQQLLLNDALVLKKYTEMMDTTEVPEVSDWGTKLVSQLKEKETLESLNFELVDFFKKFLS